MDLPISIRFPNLSIFIFSVARFWAGVLRVVVGVWLLERGHDHDDTTTEGHQHVDQTH